MIRYAGLTLMLMSLLLVGCSKDTYHDMSGDNESMPAHKSMQGGDTGNMHGDMGKMHGSDSGAARLPAGANEVCPVSGDAVDPSVSVEYQGKKVYFCCSDCVAAFNREPQKYFAKAYPDAGK